MIYLENNQNIQDVWIPRQEVNQTAFTRYASEEYVDNAIANETARTENTYAKKTDLTAYTPTEDFATINGSAITHGGNIVIETGGNYSAGTNIKIEDDVISVTGITVPTKLSDLENDEGFITDNALSGYSTTEEMNSAITSATRDMATKEWTKGNVILSMANETARTEETYAKISSLEDYTPTSGFTTINGQAITNGGNIQVEGTPYSGGTNIQVEEHIISVTGITVPTKLSDLTNDEGFITTADTQDFVTSADVKTQIEDYGYITEEALSGYSTTQEMNTAIDNAVSGKQDTSAMTQYYTSGETDTAISNATSGLASQSWVENKGYLTGYTESDPVFMASAASGITAQDITNWNAVTGITVPTKLSELENDEGFITSNDIPTSNTAFTNDAGYITSDALSGYAATSALTPIQNQINEVEEVTATALDDLNDRVDEISGNSVTTGTVQSMITAATEGLASETYVDNSVSGKADSSAVTADIATATAATTGWVESQGYLTGYTETEPIFTGSPAYGITSTDISNWNAVTGLTIPTSNTAFTNDAGYITEDAISGKVDTSRVDEIEEVAASAITNLNTRVVELSGNSVTTGTVESMITAATSGMSQKLDISVFESSDLAVSHAINDLESRKVASNDVRDIVKMSQNDYDSLSAKSATTLYIII